MPFAFFRHYGTGTVPGGTSAEGNIFEPVLRNFRWRRIVPPRIRVARAERNGLSELKRGTCQQLQVYASEFAGNVAVDIETEIVYFKPCSPLDEDTIFIRGGAEGYQTHEGWSCLNDREGKSRDSHRSCSCASGVSSNRVIDRAVPGTCCATGYRYPARVAHRGPRASAAD